MFKSFIARRNFLAAAIVTLSLFGQIESAHAKSDVVRCAFKGRAEPGAGLIAAKAGNLYNTTTSCGGTGCSGYGRGTLFKIDPNGRETVLHPFSEEDGAFPVAGLIADAQGDLYGTTIEWAGKGWSGCGAVSKLGPDGTQKLSWRFGNGNRRFEPMGELWKDRTGELFGTTLAVDDSVSGTIFKLTQ